MYLSEKIYKNQVKTNKEDNSNNDVFSVNFKQLAS